MNLLKVRQLNESEHCLGNKRGRMPERRRENESGLYSVCTYKNSTTHGHAAHTNYNKTQFLTVGRESKHQKQDCESWCWL